MFNISVTTGEIPYIWKKGHVIPLPKPGKDHNKPDGFRPVSLISPVVKVLERLMLPQLQQHLRAPSHQHGFTKLRSTTTALTTIHQFITAGLNRKAPVERTVAVALDLKSAFDTVDLRLLGTDIASSSLPLHHCNNGC